jgi:hypothetical protein
VAALARGERGVLRERSRRQPRALRAFPDRLTCRAGPRTSRHPHEFLKSQNLGEPVWNFRLHTAGVVSIALMVALAPQPVPGPVRAFAILAALSHAALARALGQAREWARLTVGAFQVLAWACMGLTLVSFAISLDLVPGAALWIAVAVVGCFPRPMLGARAREQFSEARAVLERDRARSATARI